MHMGGLLDTAFLVVLAIYGIMGWRRGFVRGLEDLFSFLLSLALALRLYGPASQELASRFQLPVVLGRPLAFVALWMLLGLLVGIVAGLALRPAYSAFGRSFLDSFVGVFAGLARGFVALAFALSVVVALPLPGLLRDSLLSSALARFLVERSENLSQSLNEIVAQPASEAIVSLTIHPESGEMLDLGFTVPDPPLDGSGEQELLDMMNQERARRGLLPLAMDATLRAVARSHSVDMLEHGYFSHNDLTGVSPFQRMKVAGAHFETAAENIALSPTVALSETSLMESPGHRANILNPAFRRVGVGVASAGLRGKMVTEDFIN